MKVRKQVSKIINNAKNIKILSVLAMISIFLFYIGCAPTWGPSDNEAIQFVRDHYLFYANGEAVQATVASRGEYIEKRGCYPITFEIISSSGRKSTKTFYFYKNESGKVEMREF
ncbi:MAG: hypothetical protein ISR97_00865 [Nitrospira sp.]|nr:hypothetical protein [Nitrospira sp.]